MEELQVSFLEREDWERFTYSFRDKVYSGDLEKYERWKAQMGSLLCFWALPHKKSWRLGVKKEGRIRGVLTVSKVEVPFFERRLWKDKEERGEIEDIYLEEKDEGTLSSLLFKAIEILREEDVLEVGISEWKRPYFPLLERRNFFPYARSVLLGWESRESIRKKPNPLVSIKKAGPEELETLRDIQMKSWGFFIPPDFDAHLLFVAYRGGKPVGSAYLNKKTGNIDFGIHVVQDYWRMRVGTTLLCALADHSRMLGLELTVVRAIELTKVKESDQVALRFYFANGATLMREYFGFREMRRTSPLSIPLLEEFLGILVPKVAKPHIKPGGKNA